MTLHAPGQPSASNKSGEVRGASASPVTVAPIRSNQNASHAPLKPVCPVSNTRRPCQKLGSGAGNALTAAGFTMFAMAPALIATNLPTDFLAQRIHRLPETGVFVGHELLLLR
jgi:hypothetical protein